MAHFAALQSESFLQERLLVEHLPTLHVSFLQISAGSVGQSPGALQTEPIFVPAVQIFDFEHAATGHPDAAVHFVPFAFNAPAYVSVFPSHVSDESFTTWSPHLGPGALHSAVQFFPSLRYAPFATVQFLFAQLFASALTVKKFVGVPQSHCSFPARYPSPHAKSEAVVQFFPQCPYVPFNAPSSQTSVPSFTPFPHANGLHVPPAAFAAASAAASFG